MRYEVLFSPLILGPYKRRSKVSAQQPFLGKNRSTFSWCLILTSFKKKERWKTVKESFKCMWELNSMKWKLIAQRFYGVWFWLLKQKRLEKEYLWKKDLIFSLCKILVKGGYSTFSLGLYWINFFLASNSVSYVEKLFWTKWERCYFRTLGFSKF